MHARQNARPAPFFLRLQRKRQGIDGSDDRDWLESVGNEGGFFGKGARIQQSAVATAGAIPVSTSVQYHWI